MRSLRVVGLGFTLLALLMGASVGLGACSSSSGPAAAGSSGSSGSSGGLDGSLNPNDASANGDADASSGGDGGPVVPDTACGAAGGSRATVYPGGAQAPLYEAMGTVGARRAAQVYGGAGFVLFDADGKSPSAQPIVLGADLNRIARSGTVLGVVGATLPEILFQRYDTSGAVVGGGAALSLGSGPSGDVTIGQSGGAFLSVWSGAQGVTARGVDAAGQLAGPAFALDPVAQQNFTASVVSAGGSSFGVLWVGYTFTSPGHTLIRTAFATASATGVTATKDISADDQSRGVVQLVKTPTGYAALLDEPAGAPDFTPRTRLLILDESGNVMVSPPPILAGAVRGLSLAAQGTELGVVVERASQTVAFRPFDASAKPLGPWVCLGSTAPSLNAAAVDADGAGYAVIFGSTNRSVVLARFDRLGK